MAKKRIVATGNWSSQQPPPPPKARPAPPPPPPPAPQSSPDKAGIFQKAKNMAKAYASKGLSGKRAEEDIVEIRNISCHGLGDINLPPCEFRGTSEENKGRHFCLECGCGDRQATWLNALNEDDYTKLHFPNVVCPLNMPGFSNYTSVKDETEERKSHYRGFTRKQTIENYSSSMGLDLVELTFRQNNNTGD
tara:strand:- start:2978 stop:3553 length:576 start_codon:yes stop_codon:yes gene_type:complete